LYLRGVARTWFVTGASSGFGYEITRQALERGDNVVAGARRVDALSELRDRAPERVLLSRVDVIDAADRERALQEAIERFGRIDVLVNNAGHTQVGAVEETTDEELRDLFELHFFGPAALTRAVLPGMREQGGGWVVQMSSVGGQVTAPGFSAYCATKFALEGFSETLRDEVAQFGVKVLIVEPGAFRTGLFGTGAARFSEPISAYDATVGSTREYVTTGGGSQPGDPAKAAKAILTAIDSPEPPLRLVLGEDAIGNIRGHLASVSAEIDRWAPVGSDTAVSE
jgi:NAD(P)-dependent dehydrogenase (short-subunit alcohol dehydrogenase family)